MEILTVGHGSQSIESFIDLLRRNRVEVLVDTRSTPFSGRHPQFSQRVLATLLDEAGISGVIVMKTAIGGERVVDMMSGEQLPRIC